MQHPWGQQQAKTTQKEANRAKLMDHSRTNIQLHNPLFSWPL